MKTAIQRRTRRGIAQQWLIVGGVAAAAVVGLLIYNCFKKDDRRDFRSECYDGREFRGGRGGGGWDQDQHDQMQQSHRTSGTRGGGWDDGRDQWRHNRWSKNDPRYCPPTGGGKGGPGNYQDQFDKPWAPGSESDGELERLSTAAKEAKKALEAASRSGDAGAMGSAQQAYESAQAALAAKKQSML